MMSHKGRNRRNIVSVFQRTVLSLTVCLTNEPIWRSACVSVFLYLLSLCVHMYVFVFAVLLVSCPSVALFVHLPLLWVCVLYVCNMLASRGFPKSVRSGVKGNQRDRQAARATPSVLLTFHCIYTYSVRAAVLPLQPVKETKDAVRHWRHRPRIQGCRWLFKERNTWGRPASEIEDKLKFTWGEEGFSIMPELSPANLCLRIDSPHWMSN